MESLSKFHFLKIINKQCIQQNRSILESLYVEATTIQKEVSWQR